MKEIKHDLFYRLIIAFQLFQAHYFFHYKQLKMCQ